MTPEMSVVVATYNRAASVVLAVSCLEAQDVEPSRYEIIVADDGSTDGTANALAPWVRPGRASLLHLPRGGRSAARNSGICAARGRLVAFVDSDAFAPPWFVGAHIDAHAKHPHSIVDGPAIDVDSFSPGAFTSFRVRLLAALDVGGEEFVTVNTSCPREALLRANGFDTRFGLRYGWEDIDLGVRLRRLGLRRTKARRAYVLHQQQSRPLEAEGDLREECGANAALYIAEHSSRADRRRVGIRSLRVDSALRRCGITPDRLQSLAATGSKPVPISGLARNLYLLQRYAEGMRRELAAAGTAPGDIP